MKRWQDGAATNSPAMSKDSFRQGPAGNRTGRRGLLVDLPDTTHRVQSRTKRSKSFQTWPPDPSMALSQHGTWTSCGWCPDVLREQVPEVVDAAKSEWWHGCLEEDSGLLQPPTALLVRWSKSATRMQLPVWMTANHVEYDVTTLLHCSSEVLRF